MPELPRKRKREDFCCDSSAVGSNNQAAVPRILHLATGFSTPPQDKQPGGKKNRKPLPSQKVVVRWSNVPKQLRTSVPRATPSNGTQTSNNVDESSSCAKLQVILTRKKDEPSEAYKVIEVLDTRPIPRTGAESTEHEFSELVVQHSSHNHGQALKLLFRLFDSHGNILEDLPTAHFETITRRGIEKQKQKKNSVTKKQLPTCTLTNVYPNTAPSGVPTYVRLEGTKIGLRAKEQNCTVLFGEERASGVFIHQNLSISQQFVHSPSHENQEDNMILVCTPAEAHHGTTSISVVFGDGSRSNNALPFTFRNLQSDASKNSYIRELSRRVNPPQAKFPQFQMSGQSQTNHEASIYPYAYGYNYPSWTGSSNAQYYSQFYPQSLQSSQNTQQQNSPNVDFMNMLQHNFQGDPSLSRISNIRMKQNMQQNGEPGQ